MNLKDIQDLIKFVAKSGATEVDLEIDNVKISIKSPPKKRRGETQESIKIIERETPSVIANPQQTPVIQAEIPSASNAQEKNNEEKPKENGEENYITITASMIGTFYRSSSPESDPFVNVGDIIKEGDTICIIEAMKLFNEIESEVSGKIIKVLVDDATPIEFDQPLFLVDPS